MPRILSFAADAFVNSNIVQIELDKEGLQVDSRIIGMIWDGFIFKCRIDGKVLTVERSCKLGWDHIQASAWSDPHHFRIYDPEIEEVPPFNSKIYTYFGLENERAPMNIREVIVHPSVSTIKKWAFYRCDKMIRCTMGDHVKRIEENAFFCCLRMRDIRLSRNLKFIGPRAFWNCYSIDCMYVPSTVEEIELGAFEDCSGMRILVLPPDINLARVGDYIVRYCHSLHIMQDTGPYKYPLKKFYMKDWSSEGGGRDNNYNRILNYKLKYQYDRLPFLRLCLDPFITAQMIKDFLREHGTVATNQMDDRTGWKPLHILAGINQFANMEAIVACANANPEVLFHPDRKRQWTPLDYLWRRSNVEAIVHVIHDLCIHRRKKGDETLQHESSVKTEGMIE